MVLLCTLDRYIARNMIVAFVAVMAIVVSLMILEHLPRLIELTRFSGNQGYVVIESLAGLLPEYAGIGLLVGLYLALALLVRKLTLRGELDAVEASGIAPSRWMRLPIMMTAAVAMFTLFNQGWLIPDAERRLDALGMRMAAGEFGYALASGQFIDLGQGSMLRFDSVARDGRSVEGIFLRTDSRTFTAREGLLSLQVDGAVLVDLRNGQSIGEGDGSTSSFTRLKYASSQVGPVGKPGLDSVAPAKFSDLDTLIADGTTRSWSVALGRLMWALLAPVAAVLAFVLGKPPKRSMGASGLFLGCIVLITCIKMLAPLEEGMPRGSGFYALGVAVSWTALAFGLLKMEAVLGRGFVDRWLDRVLLQARTLLRPNRGKTGVKFGKSGKMIVD